jgi:hypothetical protein
MKRTRLGITVPWQQDCRTFAYRTSASPLADRCDDDKSLQLDVVPAADSPEWKAICRALAKHGFRLPGTTRHDATQCVHFGVYVSTELRLTVLCSSAVLCGFEYGAV